MKLIAVDLDGTLLNSKNEISKRTKDSIIKAIDEGNKVVIATGRDLLSMKDIAEELEFEKHGGLISNANGASVYDYKNKKEIAVHLLDENLVKEIIEYGNEIGIDIIIYNNGVLISDKKNPYTMDTLIERTGLPVEFRENLSKNIDFPVNKILFAKEPETLLPLIEGINDKFGSRINAINSEPHYLDIMPPNISKGISILEIADYYGIDHKDIIAFGDQKNDHAMIEMSGVGVAMGNAIDEIKEVADFITLSNDEDGVAYYLEKYVLEK